jgi:N-carbamoylputrescine amidase
MASVTIAATQAACTSDVEANLDQAERLVRDAAGRGAEVVLLQELFATEYFCKDERAVSFDLAEPLATSRVVARFASLARELSVVLPISFFERANHAFFNSVAVLDADGSRLGCYRKSHIPDGPGYEEKYYFSPGDTGFLAFETAYATLGVGICWDQWFPECARAMVLQGAEVLCYPTAIGSEPQDRTLDSSAHWRRTMQGHAAANMVPLVASNRIGTEVGASCELTFLCDHTGAVVAEANRTDEAVLVHRFDLDEVARARRGFGLFRDRRPDLYGPLLTLDGLRRTPSVET